MNIKMIQLNMKLSLWSDIIKIYYIDLWNDTKKINSKVC